MVVFEIEVYGCRHAQKEGMYVHTSTYLILISTWSIKPPILRLYTVQNTLSTCSLSCQVDELSFSKSVEHSAFMVDGISPSASSRYLEYAENAMKKKRCGVEV